MHTQFIHPSAHIDPAAKICEGTIIGANCQVGPEVITSVNVTIGKDTRIFGAVKIGPSVHIGDAVTIMGPWDIQTDVRIGEKAVIGVAMAASSTLPCGLIGKGARIGDHAVVLGRLSIGEFAFVRPEARLEGDLHHHGVASGQPAALVDFVCECGRSYAMRPLAGELYLCKCPACHGDYRIVKMELAKRYHYLLPGQQVGARLQAWDQV